MHLATSIRSHSDHVNTRSSNQNDSPSIVGCIFKPTLDSSFFQKPTFDMNIVSGFPRFVTQDMFMTQDMLGPSDGFVVGNEIFIRCIVDWHYSCVSITHWTGKNFLKPFVFLPLPPFFFFLYCSVVCDYISVEKIFLSMVRVPGTHTSRLDDHARWLACTRLSLALIWRSHTHFSCTANSDTNFPSQHGYKKRWF